MISPMLFNEAWNMPYTNGNLVCRIVELILDTAKFDVYVSVQVRLHVKGKELKQIHHDGSTSSRTICCGIAFVEMIKSDLQSKHVQAVLFVHHAQRLVVGVNACPMNKLLGSSQ